MSINYKKQDEEILALSYALKILAAWFKEVPQIDNVTYVDGVPEPVRTLIRDQINYRQIQLRIYNISQATWLTIPDVRRLMKTKTLSELEAFKKVWDKIIIEDKIRFDRPLEEDENY